MNLHTCCCAGLLDCAVPGEPGDSFVLEEGQGEAASQAIHVSLDWAGLGSVNHWHLALCRESTTHLLTHVIHYSTTSIFQPFSPLWQSWRFGLGLFYLHLHLIAKTCYGQGNLAVFPCCSTADTGLQSGTSSCTGHLAGD